MQHGQPYQLQRSWHQLTIQGLTTAMESNLPITVSPNGANGAASTHTLDSAAAGQALDAALISPFAQVEPTEVEPELPSEAPPTDLPRRTWHRGRNRARA